VLVSGAGTNLEALLKQHPLIGQAAAIGDKRKYVAALIVLFFGGVSVDFYSTINNTLIMLNTDRALYGRVMSIYMMTWSLAPLSSAPFGALMDHIGGPPTMIIIGGVLAVFVVSMTAFRSATRQLA